jgi:predicted NodU family carbamoyl transferase
LDEGSISLGEVDYVAFYDKPFLKFERLLETYVAFAPRGFRSFRMAIPLWLKEKLFQKQLLRDEPLVRTPEEAFRCFMGTELDVLAVGNLYLQKSEQNLALKVDYRNAFELD